MHQQSLLLCCLLKALASLVLIIFSIHHVPKRNFQHISKLFQLGIFPANLKISVLPLYFLMILPNGEKERRDLIIFSHQMQCNRLLRKDFFSFKCKVAGSRRANNCKFETNVSKAEVQHQSCHTCIKQIIQREQYINHSTRSAKKLRCIPSRI